MDLTVHFRDGNTEEIPDFESVVCLGMDKNVVKAEDFSNIYLENQITYSFVGHADSVSYTHLTLPTICSV